MFFYMFSENPRGINRNAGGWMMEEGREHDGARCSIGSNNLKKYLDYCSLIRIFAVVLLRDVT